MIKKYFSAVSLLKNLGKITEIINASYIAIVKIIATLQFIQNNVNDTKLGNKLDQYIPKINGLLTKVKEIIEKYGKYINFVPPVESSATIQSESILKELDKSFKDLDALLK